MSCRCPRARQISRVYIACLRYDNERYERGYRETDDRYGCCNCFFDSDAQDGVTKDVVGSKTVRVHIARR